METKKAFITHTNKGSIKIITGTKMKQNIREMYVTV